jgi:hypothetical protein
MKIIDAVTKRGDVVSRDTNTKKRHEECEGFQQTTQRFKGPPNSLLYVLVYKSMAAEVVAPNN